MPTLSELIRFPLITTAQEAELRKWAHDNYDPQRHVDDLYHPVIAEEWAKITAEQTYQARKDAFTALLVAWGDATKAGLFNEVPTEMLCDEDLDEVDNALAFLADHFGLVPKKKESAA